MVGGADVLTHIPVCSNQLGSIARRIDLGKLQNPSNREQQSGVTKEFREQSKSFTPYQKAITNRNERTQRKGTLL